MLLLLLLLLLLCHTRFIWVICFIGSRENCSHPYILKHPFLLTSPSPPPQKKREDLDQRPPVEAEDI